MTLFDYSLGMPINVKPKGALHRCSYWKVFWKYAENLQESIITLWHGYYWNHTSARVFSVNLLHIFRTTFPKNTFGGLLVLCLFHRGCLYIRVTRGCFQMDNLNGLCNLNDSIIIQPILVQCHISAPLENVRKPKVFWYFQGL